MSSGSEDRGSRVEDGGPAYGSSLRDYFAVQALAGIIAKSPHTCDGANVPPEVMARARGAYAYADAMLEARKR
jgi:hypothetical protein